MNRLLRITIISLALLLFSHLNGSISSYNRLEYKNFTVLCHSNDMDEGREIILMAKDIFPEIARNLRLLNEAPITIILAHSDKHFRLLTDGKVPEWGGGAADTHNRIIWLKPSKLIGSKQTFKKIVAHELSHIALGMVLNGKSVDRWFEEGMALYHSGEYGWSQNLLLARNFFFGGTIPLNDIDRVLNFRLEKASLAYQESLSAVKYLTEKYGKEILSKIAWTLRSNTNMDLALNKTIGIGFDEFESQWYKTMKNKYRWYPIMDYRFIFSLLIILLFIAAVISVKRKQMRKNWDEGELYGFK